MDDKILVLRLRQLGGKSAGKSVILLEVKVDEIMTVKHLRQTVSAATGVPVSRLKMVHKGKPLRDYSSLPKFADNDAISYAMALKAPDQALREDADGGFEEDEARELQFDVESQPQYLQKLAHFLKYKCRFPDPFLVVLFSISPFGYATVVLWIIGAKLSSQFHLGPIYIIVSIFVLILMNLGKRKEGEASAYSVYNNFQTLPGQLTLEMLERQLVRGQPT